MVFALRRTNSIVRFWELIACKVGLVYFGALVVCFVGFRDGSGIGGLDNGWGDPLGWDTRTVAGLGFLQN